MPFNKLKLKKKKKEKGKKIKAKNNSKVGACAFYYCNIIMPKKGKKKKKKIVRGLTQLRSESCSSHTSHASWIHHEPGINDVTVAVRSALNQPQRGRRGDL